MFLSITLHIAGRPGPIMEGMDADRTPPKRRLTVSQAALELGTTSEGVRSRIKRGTLEAERVEGRVWVILEGAPPRPDADQARPNAAPTPDQSPLVEELSARVAFLEAELHARTEEARRKDHLLAAALERIPALEAPGDPESASEPAQSTQGPPEAEPGGETRRRWWEIWRG